MDNNANIVQQNVSKEILDVSNKFALNITNTRVVYVRHLHNLVKKYCTCVSTIVMQTRGVCKYI